MALVVDVPAPSHNLTTVEAVVETLDLSPTDRSTHSQFINALISRASDFIKTYTNRVFAKETVTETLVSTGAPILVLSRTPIVSITSVTFDNTTVIDPSEYVIEDAGAGFLYREKGWAGTQFDVGSFTRLRSRYGRYDWKVQYVGGYDLPPSTSANLPADVGQACIELVKYWFLNRSRDGRIVRERVGDSSVEFAANSEDLSIPPNIKMLLDPWVRVLS